MKNRSWPKWIRASITQHFLDNMKGVQYVYVEGQHRIPTDQKVYVEFRFNGPNFNEVSRNCYSITVNINVLIQGHTGLTEIYNTDKIAGRVLETFAICINILKYGNELEDDESVLDTLQLDGEITTTQFGKIAPGIELEQTALEATYKTLLTGD